MEWSKLKNIVLIILVCTNLALLAIVARQEIRNNYYSRLARQEAIQFLSDRGVAVTDENCVPEQMTLLPQTAERAVGEEEKAAAALLGSDLLVEDRGAGVYRYSSEKGFLQFHSDGSLQGEFPAGAFPGEGEQACLDLLALLNMTCDPVEAGDGVYTFRQRWGNAPFFNQHTTVEIREGSIRSLTAQRRLPGQPQEKEGEKTVTVATALVNLYQGITQLGDVCSRVDGIAQGYVISSSLNGPVVLTPVWRVDTDTGDYQLDLLTGALTRVS